MKNKYIDEILSYIKNPFVKEKIRKELLNHLEEKQDYYLDNKYSKEEAEEKAISSMGNSEIIGQQLNEVHRPYISYLVLASKLLFITAILSVFLSIIPAIINVKDEILARKHEEENIRLDLSRNFDKIINTKEKINFIQDRYIINQIAYNKDNDDLAFVLKKQKTWFPSAYEYYDTYYLFEIKCENLECGNHSYPPKANMIWIKDGKKQKFINFIIDSGFHQETYQLNLQEIIHD